MTNHNPVGMDDDIGLPPIASTAAAPEVGAAVQVTTPLGPEIKRKRRSPSKPERKPRRDAKASRRASTPTPEPFTDGVEVAAAFPERVTETAAPLKRRRARRTPRAARMARGTVRVRLSLEYVQEGSRYSFDRATRFSTTDDADAARRLSEKLVKWTRSWEAAVSGKTA